MDKEKSKILNEIRDLKRKLQSINDEMQATDNANKIKSLSSWRDMILQNIIYLKEL
jgi:uncharacterized coiled-coil DUF342 family protein